MSALLRSSHAGHAVFVQRDGDPGSAQNGDAAATTPADHQTTSTADASDTGQAVAEIAAGIAYGSLQGVTPGGFLAPSPDAGSRRFEFFRAAGETAAGIAEIAAGVGGEFIGGGLDATGIGAIVGVPINVVSAALIAQGAMATGAGAAGLAHAMSMSSDTGGGGDAGGGPGGDSGGAGPTGPVRKGPIPNEEPANLNEQQVMGEAQAGEGQEIMQSLNDEPRLAANYGDGEWVKMELNKNFPDGSAVSIHWFRNKTSAMDVEFKFKTGQVRNPLDASRRPGF